MIRKLKNQIIKLQSYLLLKKTWEGNVQPSKSYKLVFFSHFDDQGEVHEYVTRYLKELQENNCLIIFISTSPFLTNEAVEKLKPYCYKILLRKNEGLDFGSWRTGYDLYKGLLKNASGLLLTNDSCFGPLYSLKPIFESFDSKDRLSGITFNHDPIRHLQSYFLYFTPTFFYLFKQFFYNVSYLKNKEDIIWGYEMGLSLDAMKRGYKLNAWVDNRIIENESPSKEGQGNHSLWRCNTLLENKRSPFIKRAVFTNSKDLAPEANKKAMDYIKANHPDYALVIEDYLHSKNIAL